MSEFSRVKKFEELRNEIETDQKGTAIYPNGMKINQTINNNKEEVYTPTHERVFKQNEETKSASDTASFKNEYLDSFIQEVRDYNIQKGIRESEDTKLDILQQLTTTNRERRSNYIEKIEDVDHLSIDTPNMDSLNTNIRNEETLEISRQVFDLLNGDEESSEAEESNPLQEEEISEEAVSEQTPETKKVIQSLDERIAFLEKELNEAPLEDVVPSRDISKEEEDELSSITKKELIEQTMQLKVKMDQYEDELSGINSDVDSNNRLLNIIITILIIALLGVIGMVVYWLVSGGII